MFGASGASLACHAEYAVRPADGAIAILPDEVSFGPAVALTDGALTALPFLRDTARIQAGQRSPNSLAGIYVSTVPGLILLQSMFTKRAAISFTGLRKEADKRPDLVELARLAEEGVLRPLVDGVYALDDIVAAHARVDSGRKRGTVVVTPSTHTARLKHHGNT